MKQIKKLSYSRQVATLDKISAKVSSIHTDFGLDSFSGMGIKLSSSGVSDSDNLDNIGDTSIFGKVDAIN